MWCYQKPGFEALLLAELQRQQQRSQFCDTLLKTDGVSVPAHSCILSAISPQISSALSSTPPPPPGQSRLLDFGALGACTLLHTVSLLYSGEMAGAGEKERQEAISAAAKLGIHGLVEVTGRDSKSRREEEKGQRAELGVQTQPVMSEENEGRRVRWRRDVRDGETLLWKEAQSDGDKDTCAQTEELLVKPAPSHPSPSFETIDLAALQSLSQTDPNFITPQIPYVPVSLVYPPDDNQAHQPPSAPVDYLQRSTAAGQTPVVVAPPHISGSSSIPSFSSQANLCDQSWWACPQGADRDVAGGGESEDERLKQFQNNIPGYINYFLNPDIEEDSYRGRARGRRRARVASVRRAGTGERRARRPRARTGQRGRGGFTQTVDVQEVRVSRLQKLFLQRSGRRVSKTGQGGGAAGRSLCVKTRELLKPARSCRRRRVLDTFCEVSPSRNALPKGGRGAGNTTKTTPQSNQDDRPVSRPRRARAKPTSLPLSSPPMQSYNVRTLWASSPSLQPSPSPSLFSPAASYVSSASRLLHTASACPSAPPPHEEQPEHYCIDRLLEEVMMGLDILPKNNNSAPHPRPLPPASSSSCSSVNALAQNKQQNQIVVVERGADGSYSANSEVPILQEQGEGELNEMLENILLSFEQHIDSCTAGEEEELGGPSCTVAPVSSSQLPARQQSEEDEALARGSQPLKASSDSHAPDKHVERSPGKVMARRKKWEKKAFMLSLEKKRVKKPGSAGDTATRMFHDRGDKQLQQNPVVKLERGGALPVRGTLQGHSSQRLDVKDIAKAKTSSSVKSQHDSLSGKNQTVWWSTKTYPIRSRFGQDSMPILEESLLQRKGSPSAGQTGRRPGRPRKDGQLLSLSNDESSTPPVQPQALEPCGAEKQLEIYKERQEQEVTVLPQDEAEVPTRRGKKRGTEEEEKTSDDGIVAKRVCFAQMPQQSSEACTPHSESVETEPAVVVEVETVSLTSVGDRLQRQEQEEKPAWSEIELRKTEQLLTYEENKGSDEEIIDVDGDSEDDCQKDAEKESRESRTAPALPQLAEMKSSSSPPSHSEVSLEVTGCCEEDKDEDIDVVGGCSPAPEPVIISWTESSEGDDEDEDVELVGQQTNYTSSAALATVSTGELVNRACQTEVL